MILAWLYVKCTKSTVSLYIARNMPSEDNMNKKMKEVIEEMAEVGFNTMYDDEWKDIDKSSIEVFLWKEVAFNMLRSIKFPSGLYQICYKMSLMNKTQIKEFLNE